jgi:hypothetical protein
VDDLQWLIDAAFESARGAETVDWMKGCSEIMEMIEGDRAAAD